MKNKLFNIGLLLLIFVVSNIFLTSILFLFGVSITKWNFIIASIIAFVIDYFLLKKQTYNIKEKIVVLLISILSIIFCFILGGITYDHSFDGNNYHKVAIGEMKMGWNPVYENIEEFDKNSELSLEVPELTQLWTNHYAKGYYMYAANVYSITDNIETGKSFNFLLAGSLFLILLSYLLTKFNKTFSIIITSLVVFNPIFLPQLILFYNDLNVASLLFLLITSLVMIIDTKCKIPFKYLLFITTLILLINIKASAFGYAGIYSLVFFLYIIFNKKQRKINFKKMLISGIIGVVIGVFIIGGSTYVKNTIDHGHPFYPLYGEGKVDIIVNQISKKFYEMNRFEKFFVANNAVASNYTKYYNIDPELKIPFTFSKQEFNAYYAYDTRMAGFGVLFGGILLVSTIILGYFLIFKRKKNQELFWSIFLPTISMLLIMLVVADTWWARYFPQLYLIPIFTIIYLKVFKNKIGNIIKIGLLALMIMNISFFVKIDFQMNTTRTISINDNFKNYTKYKEREKSLIIDATDFEGIIYNYYDIDKNVKFKNSSNIITSEYYNCLNYHTFAKVYCKN